MCKGSWLLLTSADPIWIGRELCSRRAVAHSVCVLASARLSKSPIQGHEALKITLSAIENHVVTAAEGCAEHGIDCQAYEAIKASTQLGWDPFR